MTTAVSAKEKSSVSGSPSYPVVGIGASAGGLEALEQFLSHVPEKSGMAYVVIQHLDPTQKGMLPELLQRITKMKVYLAKEGLSVQPDCVYVIPPNKSMSILQGKLVLSEPLEIRGLRLPIDFFLRSLAEDFREHSVALILSGMGSDGTLGIQAIKERGGIVMVQDPETAKFDSMPRNAIGSTVADIVAPVDQLPQKLTDLFSRVSLIHPDAKIDQKDKSALEKIIILLRNRTGSDFMFYKKSMVYRRIERRMMVHKIKTISDYVSFLIENGKELDILFKELLIGVTNFFRDPAVWKKLEESVLPFYISEHRDKNELRAWIVGCSTGEEAYSMAIAFREAMKKIVLKQPISLHIFATDLDNDAIEIARKGVFPLNISNDVPAAYLKRYFIKTDEGFRIKNEIREMIVFARHNIIMDPPFTKMDILCCRNLLIYLEPELQQKILGLFFYSLHPEGIMVLGSSETLGKQSHLFRAGDSTLKIYKRSSDAGIPELFNFPSSYSPPVSTNVEKLMTAKPPEDIQTLADRYFLEHFTPVGVLVNDSGDIIYFSGRTGKYLEPAAGKANMNIFAMLREGLQHVFPVAFQKALMTEEEVVLPHVRVGTNSSSQILDVNIQKIDKPGPLNGLVMIIFSDVPPARETEPPLKKLSGKTDKKILELQEELRAKREEMLNAVEEMQTSQEELKSTNEELQSTNEELQSANEELTSSKEEMQSLNEELQTVNAELQAKVDDFVKVDNDMKNLLNSTDIATLFLDKELNIRRYTTQATRIFKLIKSDVGRPITDLVTDLDYPGLQSDAREVLHSLVFLQKQIPARDNRWYSVRIMPYRTSDDKIDGLVITFMNITEIKQADAKLSENEQFINLLAQNTTDHIVRLSLDLEIRFMNPVAEKFFGRTTEQVVNLSFIQLFITDEKKNNVEDELKKIIKSGNDDRIKLQTMTGSGDLSTLDWSVSILRNDMNMPAGLVLITLNT